MQQASDDHHNWLLRKKEEKRKKEISNNPDVLHVLDWHTPWVWITVLYDPIAYGDSWLKIELWKPEEHRRKTWWLNFWNWRERPNEYPFY